jgi:hypothetical protein
MKTTHRLDVKRSFSPQGLMLQLAAVVLILNLYRYGILPSVSTINGNSHTT